MINYQEDRQRISFLPSANEVAERLYFYTWLSFCSQGGVCPSACWDTPPGSRHPPRSRHSPEQTPSPGADPPPTGSRHPPPRQQTPTAADGTHPTGMHSCSRCVQLRIIFRSCCFTFALVLYPTGAYNPQLGLVLSVQSISPVKKP